MRIIYPLFLVFICLVDVHSQVMLTFGEPEVLFDVPGDEVSGLANGFVAGDINGDDLVDLVGSSRFQTLIALGTGMGEFSTTEVSLERNFNKLGLVDLNGDGHLDLIQQYVVLLGDGTGSFPNAVFISQGEHVG